jgi:large subunit ribosomal protein L22
MSSVTAQLNDYRQSPRKARVVANLVRGKSVADALVVLQFLAKRGALPISKLISSAVANAKSQSIDVENLKVEGIFVDSGKILYRRLPASRGRSSQLRKRTSHVRVVLSTFEPKEKKEKITAKSKSKKVKTK